MWVRVSLADLGAGARALVARLHAREGAQLTPGGILLDLEVDLGGGVVRDCPPVSTCRIVLREALWLRRWYVAAGNPVQPGAIIAELADTADAPWEEPEREARVTLVAVVQHPDWWSDAP